MFDTSLGLLSRAFGCWHRRLSRPITSEGETYRACVACGARRLFDTEKWSCYGPYFFGKARGANVADGPARRVAARAARGLALRRAG